MAGAQRDIGLLSDCRRVAVFNRGLRRLPDLDTFLGAQVVRVGFAARAGYDATAGWGRRQYAKRAREIAARLGIPFLCLEDGFLRSLAPGGASTPLSLVVDDLGIYYDATTPSRLEALIQLGITPEQEQRACALQDSWRQGRLSKYNHAREVPPPIAGPYVLVVDQTFGDASIRFGLANPESFSRMLQAALDEHPALPVVLKVHPDVISGRKRGHFDRLSEGEASRVLLLASDMPPPSLIEAAHAVYAVTSQMGFEGLLWGKPVRTFGMPFYAGWGLTHDDVPTPGRRAVAEGISVPGLVHAALIDYPRYLDPETKQRCGPERAVEWMSLQRRMRERFAPTVHALGFSEWKKPIVRAFFGGSKVNFLRKPADVPADATLAVWGRREEPSDKDRLEDALPRNTEQRRRGPTDTDAPVTVIRLEDGFLRSVGLGADLVRPLSWVMDRVGIYYDATAPSDLERLLQETVFDSALLKRARALRKRITEAGITKYNVGSGEWGRPSSGKRVVLVPGQVESDASIALGAPGLRTNIGLLQAVRQAAPAAHIVYKPHPDVVAKLRVEGAGEAEARRSCDEVVVDTPMHVLLEQVDEVHVLTSLAGFEALLRGKPVTCHGSPFYAGWGLTTDVHAHPRRTRRVTLDELVAATLILYPTYVSRTTGAFTTPERALDELLEWRAHGSSQAVWWRKVLRWVLSCRRR